MNIFSRIELSWSQWISSGIYRQTLSDEIRQPSTPRQYGKCVCWSCGFNGRLWSEYPIANIPDGVESVRVRLRQDGLATAFLRFPNRVEHWVLSPFRDGLIPQGAKIADATYVWLAFLKGVNAIAKPKT